MTIELTDVVNGDGLFDIQGKGFYAIDTLNTARLTTVPDEVEDFVEQYKNLSGGDLDYSAAMKSIASVTGSWQSSGGSLASGIVAACRELLIQFVQDDSAEPAKTLLASLNWLITDMVAAGNYVDANVIGLTLTADTDNIGDPAILYTTLRGDGKVLENTLAETIQVEVTGDSSATTPALTFTGEEAIANKLSHLWPAGSGINRQITATDPASSLLSNGDFEDTTIAHTPDDWIIQVGTPGDTVKVTAAEQQTITLSGTPTGGSYLLFWQNADGIVRGTDPIAYNGSASIVQSALRAIPGLEAATVAATGTTPNFTHTITFTGLAANVAQITSVSHLTGGSSPAIAHATTVPGDDGAYKGRALRLNSNGIELTELYHPLTLVEETVYFCHLRIRRATDDVESGSSGSSSSSESSSSSPSSSSSGGSSPSSQGSSDSSTDSSSSGGSSPSSQGSSPSSAVSSSSGGSSQSSSPSSSSLSSSSTSEGSSESSSPSSSSSSSQDNEEIRIEIVDAIDGNVTQDGEGNDNQLRIDAGLISRTSHDSEFFSFRLQRSVTQPVYLRIRISSAISSLDSVYIDEVVVIKGVGLYAGGPYVAAVSGKTPAVNEDNWDLVSTNDRAGSFQEWYNRAFDMAGKRLLLPTSGTTAINDSLIG